MKIKKILLLLLAVAFLSSCKTNNIENIIIKTQIDSLAKQISFSSDSSVKTNVCDIFPSRNWNQIVVIGPYSNSKSLKRKINIQDIDKIENEIFSISEDEGKNALIYLNNQRVTGYSLLPRFPIDFSSDSNNIYVINRSSCNSIFLKKRRNSESLSVQIHK